jgi:ribosome-associated protein
VNGNEPTPSHASPAAAGANIALGPRASVARSDVRFQFSRSGGPGGQNVNKLSTKAELRVHLRAIRGLDGAGIDRLRAALGRRLTVADEIVIACDEHRSQHLNREEAVRRLVEVVEQASRPPRRRRRTRRTTASRERRLEAKRRASQSKASRRRPDAGD